MTRQAPAVGDSPSVSVTRGKSRTLLKVPLLPPFHDRHSLNSYHISSFTLADIISTVEFDSTGNYLATGDKGGRVVLFERNESVCSSPFHPYTCISLWQSSPLLSSRP